MSASLSAENLQDSGDGSRGSKEQRAGMKNSARNPQRHSRQQLRAVNDSMHQIEQEHQGCNPPSTWLWVQPIDGNKTDMVKIMSRIWSVHLKKINKSKSALGRLKLVRVTVVGWRSNYRSISENGTYIGNVKFHYYIGSLKLLTVTY